MTCGRFRVSHNTSERVYSFLVGVDSSEEPAPHPENEFEMNTEVVGFEQGAVRDPLVNDWKAYLLAAAVTGS